MKRALSMLLAALMLLTPALAYGGGTGEAVYLNETELAGGFVYENAVSYDADGRGESYALYNEPGSEVYPIVMACDTIFGGFDLNEMAAYAESLGYNVVGAVNADFGEYTGVPTGMVVEDGIYKSSPEGNCAVGFTDGRAHVSDAPEVTLRFTNEDTGFEFETEHLNKSRTDYGAYLFSEYFSTVSTRTSGEGWFVRFEVRGGEDLALDGELELTVTEVSREGGSVPIGEDNLVLTASEAALLDWIYEGFEPGDRVTLSAECSDSGLAGCEWVTGSGNILALDGELYKTDKWNGELLKANPRTAIGVKRDGTVVYYVMDGRSDHSEGATMEELAEDLLDMGCEDVVNLDGGGSSVMALRMPGREGLTVVNEPSDGKLREVASFILFVTGKAPDGAAERLFIEEDGAYVLAGSSVGLNFAATDRGLHNTSAPADISARAQRGEVNGGVYSAPASAGEDRISLKGGGASGSGVLHIIEEADTLAVTDAETGGNVERLSLENGESVQLAVSAGYLMRDVLTGAGSVEFTVEGDIGSIDADGVFTASAQGAAQGRILVECGGLEREIPVSVAFEFADMKGHWAEENVKALFEAGVVTGVSDTEFGPGLAMKRGDFVLMLYRAAGEPAAGSAAGFSDVPDGAYYAQAVSWAVAKGITEGKGDGTFAPDDTLTRQEGFTFLYRALGELGVSFTDGDTALLDNYADGQAVAGWARASAATLISLGVVEGSDSGLNPAGSLTRAEMAKLLDTAMGL